MRIVMRVGDVFHDDFGADTASGCEKVGASPQTGKFQ